jgi:hypothetical protein
VRRKTCDFVWHPTSRSKMKWFSDVPMTVAIDCSDWPSADSANQICGHVRTGAPIDHIALFHLGLIIAERGTASRFYPGRITSKCLQASGGSFNPPAL